MHKINLLQTQALRWIINILTQHAVPYQIAGGLAAQCYGAIRPLNDIDIDIPEECFAKLVEPLKDFIVDGPARFQSDEWDLLLMTLNYQGVAIDLGGAYQTLIFNKQKQQWVNVKTNLNTAVKMNVAGISANIVCRDDLLAYKKDLARDVDLIDINQIISGVCIPRDKPMS